MVSLEDVDIWSEQDVQDQIQTLLEPEWSYDYFVDDRSWYVVRIISGDSLIWEVSSIDSRTPLLDTFWWLLGRKYSRPVDDFWSRTRELLQPVSTPQKNSPRIPLDLDPKEIESVYRKVKR